MRFCEKDGNLLVAKHKRTRTVLVCRKCGREYKVSGEKLVISETIPVHKKGIVVMGKEEMSSELPSTKIVCPNCEFGQAFWWMQQTRTAD